MKAKKCIQQLLNPNYSTQEKAEELADYVNWFETAGKRIGAGIVEGRHAALNELLKCANEQFKEETKEFTRTLAEIEKLWAEAKSDDKKKADTKGKELSNIPLGANIIIRNQGKEDIVVFIKMKRSRFICEYPDGRQYSVPLTQFVRLYEGKPIQQLSEEEKYRRSLIRLLAGKKYVSAADLLCKMKEHILKSLLDELAAAIDRIEQAPVGFSKGLLRDSLGFVKQINPQDQALVKRIPLVVRKIAQDKGEKSVRAQVSAYPNSKVQECCLKELNTL